MTLLIAWAKCWPENRERAQGKISAQPRSAPHASEAGFTLMEILIAFVILSIALAVLTQAIGNATHQIRRADDIAQLRQMAATTMAMAMKTPEEEAGKGQDKETGLSWEWRRAPIIRTDSTGPLSPVYQITVTVKPADAAQSPIVMRSLQLEALEP